MQFVFRAATEFLKCVDAGFAHRLILKDGAVPAIKDHDSELQMVSETASNFCFVGDRRKCSSLFSSAHGAPPGARRFSERIVKLYLSFINMIKLKTFWRYKGCSTLLVLKINMRLGETVCVISPLRVEILKPVQ